MSSENANVIVTPIYRVIPTEFEKISLIRGFKVFCEPMVIIYPDGMDLSFYKEIAKKYASGKRIIFKEYPKKYFESVYGYNELLLEESFYTDYFKYDNMLIYQLDAYMFDGDLSKLPDVAYIGAPCFEGFNHATELKYTGHQNGGLSMRNIKKSYVACKRAHSFSGICLLYAKKYLGKKDVLEIILHGIGIQNKQYHPYHWEDMFFSFAAPILVQDFEVASYKQAYEFAFDCLPQKLYELNNNKLPMGCHAFHKGYKWDFWSKYICEEKNEDRTD